MFRFCTFSHSTSARQEADFVPFPSSRKLGPDESTVLKNCCLLNQTLFLMDKCANTGLLQTFSPLYLLNHIGNKLYSSSEKRDVSVTKSLFPLLVIKWYTLIGRIHKIFIIT